MRTLEWRVQALDVTVVGSSYFEDRSRFPAGTVAFDHALVMRDIPHEWRPVEDLCALPQSAQACRRCLLSGSRGARV